MLSKRSPVSLYITIIIGLILSFIFLKTNNINFDLIPYIASVKKIENSAISVTTLQRDTYDALKSEVSGEAFARATDSSIKFRVNMQDDSAVFAKNLPYYGIKTGYNYFNAALKFGTSSYTKAIAANSAVFWLLTLVLTFLYLKKLIRSNWWLVILSFLICLNPHFIYGARIATPDMMSCFVVLFAFVSVTQLKLNQAYILGLLAIIVRPDNIVFSGLLGLFIFLNMTDRKVKISSAIYMLLCLATVFILIPQSGNSGNISSLYQGNYLKLLAVNISAAINETFVPFMLLLAVLGFALGYLKLYNPEGRWVILCLVIVGVKFMLVPSLENRLYLPFYLILVLNFTKAIVQNSHLSKVLNKKAIIRRL